MNKLIQTHLLSIAIIGLHLSSVAHPVDLQTAQSVASKFMSTNELQHATTYRTESNIAALFVFNTTDGFVIVSADDCETPIVGYSYEGRFDPNNVPVQMEDYLQDFVARIQYGIENHIAADELTTRQWKMVKATGRLNESKSARAIEPLLTEMWEQGCHYNELCPTFSKVPCGHAEVGCVAVAMGQIMHYWRYPETGWGSHSYSNAGLTLSADFGNTFYDWEHMPDSLTDDSSDIEVEAVATLLFHCGVSVDMQYTSNGSGADSGDVPDALIRYFNYSRRLHIEKRSDFSDEEWMSMLKDCLDLQRPVFYGGKGSQGSHAFVCDGYDGNDLLHFNWGWGRANGYFALGNLNPIGISFNEKNFAILDINPEYEPCIIEATAYPPTAGNIEGIGEYHIGEQCVLTAIPNENCEFKYWKKDGQITSCDTTITINVEGDINNYAAYFSHLPVKQIEASYAPDPNDPNSPYVNLSWTHDDTECVLLKQFDINYEDGVATDGEFIYTSNDPNSSNNYSFMFGKYTFEGELVELFNLNAQNTVFSRFLAYDGDYFYCTRTFNEIKRLHRVDLANKTYIGSISLTDIWRISTCSYDNTNNGFWLSESEVQQIRLKFVDQQGHLLSNGPLIPNTTKGTGFIIAKDGSPHLLLVSGEVYDYDINNNIIHNRPLITISNTKDACVGEYEGKDALFVISGNTLCIYEIKTNLSQIMGYRIYRTDDEGNTVMLADGIASNSFSDHTWNQTLAGSYRFGISSVFANGNESEILWSNPIESVFDAIEENDDGKEIYTDPSVQKVIEDGHIVIIKDGKRYNVSGQHLN